MGTIGKYIDTKITFKKNNKNLVEDACNLYALPVKFRHSRVLVHLSRRLKCTIVIMRCPSFVRPSSLTFHIFDLSSETAKQNLKKFDRKQDLNVLYQVCVFFGPIGKTRWPPWPLIG